MRSYTSLVLVLSAFGLLLAGCDGNREPLPQGEQTVQGLLKPAALSSVRRGTHLLEIDGEDVYFVESSIVALRNYQGKSVTLRGTFEHNIKPSFLPVLVVESIVDVEDTAAEHVLTEIGTTLTAPIHWKPVKAGESIYFTLGEGGPVIVTMAREQGDELPEAGDPIVISAKPAMHMIDALTGNEVIVVQQTPTMLFTISFTADSAGDTAKQRTDFLELLQSISFSERAPSVAPEGSTEGGESSTETIEGIGSPCGGAAGILCPAGLFCEITNFSENVGRCRKI